LPGHQLIARTLDVAPQFVIGLRTVEAKGFFLGALQSIDRELYEAAEIDGASATQQFFNVTFPMIRPVMLFMIITATIGLMNLYAPVVLLTAGGPAGTTLTLFMRMVQLMTSFRYGEGAGFGFIIGGIILIITLLQMKFLNSWWTVEGKLTK